MIFNFSKYNSHWDTKSLSQLGDFKRGKSKHRPRDDVKLFFNGKYPLIQTGEVKGSNLFINTHNLEYNDFGLSQSELWPKGTLCITIAANIAETALLSYPMCFPDSVVGFIANQEECSNVYMHYIFSYIKKEIQKRTGGSIQDNINIEYLTNLYFKIPLKREREKIESILYSIDKKIELNNKLNIELENMAQFVYNYWFVQFDFQDTNGKPYKSSGGKMVWSEELKKEIPKGWEVTTIGKSADVRKGELITEKEAMPGKIKVVAAGIEYSYLHNKQNRPPFTITVSGSGANAGIINFWREPIFASDCITIRGTRVIDTILIRQNLFHLQKHLFRQAKGSAQTHVYPDDVKDLPYVLPDEKVISKIAKTFINWNHNISNNKSETDSLIKLRDWLLPMLMNGQIKVGDLD